jgi:hypothetical protein
MPVPGAPFSAMVETVSRKSLPDGSIDIGHTIHRIARSSSGMTYNERSKREPLDFQGEFRLLRAHIYDPQTHVSTSLYPETHLARRTVLSAPSPTDSTPALGIARVQTIPAALSEIGHEIAIKDNYWYSEDLKVYLALRHSDPRTGDWSVDVSITKVDRQEPDSSTFRIPAAYKIVDETPVK